MAVQTWLSGDCTLTLNETTGEVRISGQGKMTNYSSRWSLPWENARTLFKSLIIEEGVTSIGDYTFYFCSGFTGNLLIPNSVTEIGDSAFISCSGFTGSLTVPDSVTSIENQAFYGCSGFTGNLLIPNSVTKIGDSAFSSCSGFTGSLTIPDSVTSIENNTFGSCSGFTGNLLIPNRVTKIGDSAFYGCSGFTGSLTIPDSVTSIENHAFNGCSGFTGSLIIPNGVTSIGNSTFSDCSGFTGSLIIPDSVTSIENHAFNGCSGIDRILNYGKSQVVSSYALNGLKASALFFGYPENTEFKTVAGGCWRDINQSADVVTLGNKEGRELYPRTKGEAVYLDSGRTLEAALGGLSFWRGTQAEYNALSPKPDKTVYCIIGGSVIVT